MNNEKSTITLTHGHSFLKKIIERRNLKKFCKELNLAYNYTFQIITGLSLVSTPFIFKLKNIVPVEFWFYDENEKIPERQFIYVNSNNEKWNYKETLAYKRILFESKNCGLKKWAKNHSIKYTTLWFSILNDRMPTYFLISSLKNYINPIEWFYCQKF